MSHMFIPWLPPPHSPAARPSSPAPARGSGARSRCRLAAHGCPVALCDWDEDGVRETAERISGPVYTQKLDVRDRQGQMAFAAEVREWAPAPIGLVVNNAGVTTSQTVLDASPEDDEWCFDVNFRGVVHGTRAWLPVLHEQGAGTIANVSSVFGLLGLPDPERLLRLEVRGPRLHRGAAPRAARARTSTRWRSTRAASPPTSSTTPASTSTTRAAPITPRCRATSRSSRGRAPRRRPRPSTGASRRGKDRILIGPDAVFLSLLTRVAPVRYYDVIDSALTARAPVASPGEARAPPSEVRVPLPGDRERRPRGARSSAAVLRVRVVEVRAVRPGFRSLPSFGKPPARLSIAARCIMFQAAKTVFFCVNSFSSPAPSSP